MKTKYITRLPLCLLFLFATRTVLAQVDTPSIEATLESSQPDSTTKSRVIGPSIKVLRSDPISSRSDGNKMSSSLVEVTFPPQASSPPHHHPGEVVGYVLEGTLEFKIAGKPLRVLKRGDTFFEPTMILHEIARNPDAAQTCRILVTMIHPTATKRLTIPADEVAAQRETARE